MVYSEKVSMAGTFMKLLCISIYIIFRKSEYGRNVYEITLHKYLYSHII